MNDKLLLQVKKILLKTVKNLPDNKVLPYQDAIDKIYLYFINKRGIDNIQEVKEYVNQALTDFKEKEYLNIIQEGIGQYTNYRITQGLDFDKGISEMKNKNESNFSINNLTATNVQVGNNNIQNVNYTAKEFVESLVDFEKKNSEEKKSIISNISELVKNGANLGETISKFILG